MAFKITTNELVDGFFSTGNDLAELKECIETMNSCTKFMKMKSGDINLLVSISYIGMERTETGPLLTIGLSYQSLI